MQQADRIRIFCSGIWQWYSVHKRTLPWRDIQGKDLHHTAYLVLVSEIMLQQTQVSRVTELYKKFIQQFPHAKDLARASNREVLVAWRGLGYNSRALRLRDAVSEIITQYRGTFPSDMQSLLLLPGVGHYTAAAVRNFAFGIPTPCLDTNIRRILHRFFVGMENADGTWKKSDEYLLTIAGKVLEVALGRGGMGGLRGQKGQKRQEAFGISSSSAWHAALMDFGSLVCTKNNPNWEMLSPGLRSVCKAYGKQIQRTKKLIKQEPGRMMAGRFVPNRIFRGKVVEALRDADGGLDFEEVGMRAIADWTMGDHREWLKRLIERLKHDRMIKEERGKWRLG